MDIQKPEKVYSKTFIEKVPSDVPKCNENQIRYAKEQDEA